MSGWANDQRKPYRGSGTQALNKDKSSKYTTNRHGIQTNTKSYAPSRKTHVAESNRVTERVHETMADIQRNGRNGPTQGVLDLYALIEEARKNGVVVDKHYSNRDLYHGPSIKTDLPAKFFSIGKIIVVPHPVPNLDAGLAIDDKNAVWSKLGPLNCKRRPAIIIGVYEDRCKVLPMYTHGKRGLEKKPPAVRDMALILASYESEQSQAAPQDKTLICDQLPFEAKEGLSIVYPTDSYCVNYSWPIGSNYEGHLDKRSTVHLLREYGWYHEAGQLSVKDQASFIRGKRTEAEMGRITNGLSQTTLQDSSRRAPPVKAY